MQKLNDMLKGFWKFILICTDLTNDFLAKNGPYLSAGITYYALFSLVPLTLALVALGGFFVGNSETLEDRLVQAVNSLIPISRDTVAENIKVMVSTRHVAGVVGLIGLLWVATTVFGAIRKGINTIWGISTPRRFLHERLLDFAFTAGAGTIVLVLMAYIAGAGVLSDFASTLSRGERNGDDFVKMLVNFVSPVLSFIVFMFLYRYLPNTKTTFREIWPGALLVTIAFEVNKGVFLWYTREFPVYNILYGPIGALLAMLTWAYVSSFILLFGALVTSRYSSLMAKTVEGRFQRLLAGFKRFRPTPSETLHSFRSDGND